MLHYARALLGLSAAAPPLDTQTVTMSQSGANPNRIRGYRASPVQGSISDGTSNIYGGAAINKMVFFESSSNVGDFTLEIAGEQTNSGWTTITNETDGKSLNRADATFSLVSGKSIWQWSSQPISGFFATINGTKTVVFT